MTSNPASPQKSPLQSDSDTSLDIPKVRSPEKSLASSATQQDRQPRRASPSLSAVFASTSRASSPGSTSRPAGTPSVQPITNSAFSPGKPSDATTAQSESVNLYRDLVIKSFVPHVAVLASSDTEELLAQKGFVGGLLELIRPYGEHIHGRITIRDSVGSSKSWDNYSIRFTKLKDGLESARATERHSTDSRTQTVNGYLDKYLPDPSVRLRTGGDIPFIEELIGKHLSFYEDNNGGQKEDYFNREELGTRGRSLSAPFHFLYLKRLLSGLPLSPHETFSHPVACVIAISSRNPDPIEELRQLYAATSTGDHQLPQWVNNDFLRYYVLIHDEDHDDIQKSTHLFEQMKRHFGLHCHLLRLRSVQAVASDDDCSKLPMSEWTSASEELAEIDKRESFDAIDDQTPWLFDSDISAIQSFVREMVSQSVIPMMERLSATWNDQIASRRRGISGRFLSLSKKWTPFGSSSRNSSTGSNSTTSTGNYDSVQGFYRPDTPEALMRKLGDYAFMLRDFRLANSTYELLRSDYSNDKAWKYYAGAAEMSAISALVAPEKPSTLSTKARTEGVDQNLETAVYSYTTRCSSPYYALRTLAIAVELLKPRGGAAIDDAARWAFRALELDLVGPYGHALFAERIAAFYGARTGVGSLSWGARRRKAGLWSILAVDAWLRRQQYTLAQACLAETVRLYGRKDLQVPVAFEGMGRFIQELRDMLAEARQDDESVAVLTEAISETTLDGNPALAVDVHGDEDLTEKLDIRSHRKSLIGIKRDDQEPGL